MWGNEQGCSELKPEVDTCLSLATQLYIINKPYALKVQQGCNRRKEEEKKTKKILRTRHIKDNERRGNERYICKLLNVYEFCFFSSYFCSSSLYTRS